MTFFVSPGASPLAGGPDVRPDLGELPDQTVPSGDEAGHLEGDGRSFRSARDVAASHGPVG